MKIKSFYKDRKTKQTYQLIEENEETDTYTLFNIKDTSDVRQVSARGLQQQFEKDYTGK